MPDRAGPGVVPARGPGEAPGAEAAIEVTGLIKRYKDGTEAVSGIDLSVAPGEIFGFLGPNGAGKTTTVRMLCTLLPITAGSARVAGHDVHREPDRVRARIGVALQEAGLDTRQTGRELLQLQCQLYRVPNPGERTEELLELVGLADAAARKIGAYSGGMKRRLDLASALVHAPGVLFLDEPTTGLDPASRITVWDEVRRINRDGTTVFLTTQYLEEADQLAGRVAIIDGGRIVASGTPDALKAEIGADVVTVTLAGADPQRSVEVLRALAGVQRVATGSGQVTVATQDGAAAVPAVVRALTDAGLPPGAVSVSRPSLDDVFLATTGRRIDTGDTDTSGGTATT